VTNLPDKLFDDDVEYFLTAGETNGVEFEKYEMVKEGGRYVRANIIVKLKSDLEICLAMNGKVYHFQNCFDLLIEV
jgi:hypothetical protein